MAKILIIDDDKLVRWSLRERFIQDGYSVDLAATSRNALEQAEKSSYDLVIADLEIEGENGLEIVRAIKKLSPETKIVILSALGENEKLVSLRGLKPDFVMEKPFGVERISAVVKEALSTTR